MKISLFQGILLGVFGAAALVGLFVFANYTSTGGASSAVGSVVIWGTLPHDEINAALTNATQASQSLKGVSYVEKDTATLPADLASAIATGKAPDLVLASQEELVSLAPLLAPIPLSTLSARAFANAFIEEGELFSAPLGTGYYGIPLLADPLSLFVNRTILSSASVAKPPASWEALTGLAPSVALFTNARAIIRSLIAMGTYANVDNARGILSALFLQTGTPVSLRTAAGTLSASLGETGGGGVPPGAAVVNFYTQFADPSKISYTWNASLPRSRDAFLAGDLALYLGYASEARFLAKANPNLDFDLAPLPQPATASTKKTYGLVYALMIPRGAQNASGAYQAATLLTNDAEQTAFALATGLAPASRSALARSSPDPLLAVAYSEALYAGGWLSPAPDTTDRIFSGMINAVTSGRLTTLAALSSAEQSLTALLQ